MPWKIVLIIILLNSKIWKNDMVNKCLCYFCDTEVVEIKTLNKTSMVSVLFEWLLNLPRAVLLCQISPVPMDNYLSSPVCLRKQKIKGGLWLNQTSLLFYPEENTVTHFLYIWTLQPSNTWPFDKKFPLCEAWCSCYPRI